MHITPITENIKETQFLDHFRSTIETELIFDVGYEEFPIDTIEESIEMSS